MPPKVKYTKEEIIAAALDLARERGMDAVAAREVGKRLGTSSSPIFTVWSSMEQLQEEVRSAAWNEFQGYLKVADRFNPAFKMRGMQMVRFAKEEPMLFRMLFMNGSSTVSFDEMMQTRITGFESDVRAIAESYGVPTEKAEHLFRQLWIHAYGICTLCAMKVCDFSEQEIAGLLGEVFAGMVMVTKSGAAFTGVMPAPKESEAGKRLAGNIPHVEKG